ncbi:MAG: CPBP family intramembrane metalloprotease [Phycisphaerae bacterium]|nr:CPBP family intramembrane metalloprotease [Phycisphaerae bacterium]
MAKRSPTMAVTAALRPRYGLGRYWEATQEPLYSLLFLLPLVATYEFSAMMLRARDAAEADLVAYQMLHGVLSWVGGSSVWLPGILLLVTLLVWHVWTRRDWHIHLVYLPLMLLESLILTVPLFVIGFVVGRIGLAALVAETSGLGNEIVQKLGAGLFEELVFRLYLIGGLLLLLRKGLAIGKFGATTLAVGFAALLFTACHFEPIGNLPWAWERFAAFLLDGVYLSLVFVGRGLGVVTGSHAAYNLLLVFVNGGNGTVVHPISGTSPLG